MLRGKASIHTREPYQCSLYVLTKIATDAKELHDGVDALWPYSGSASPNPVDKALPDR